MEFHCPKTETASYSSSTVPVKRSTIWPQSVTLLTHSLCYWSWVLNFRMLAKNTYTVRFLTTLSIIEIAHKRDIVSGEIYNRYFPTSILDFQDTPFSTINCFFNHCSYLTENAFCINYKTCFLGLSAHYTKNIDSVTKTHHVLIPRVNCLIFNQFKDNLSTILIKLDIQFHKMLFVGSRPGTCARVLFW